MKAFILLLHSVFLYFCVSAQNENMQLMKGTEAFPVYYEVHTESDMVDYIFPQEQMPTFPGGPDSLIRYFKSSIKYPDSTKAHGITGTVYVRFKLNMVGMLVDSEIVKSIDSYTSEACLKAVQNMPPWNHGNTRQTGATVVFMLPVNFVLKK